MPMKHNNLKQGMRQLTYIKQPQKNAIHNIYNSAAFSTILQDLFVKTHGVANYILHIVVLIVNLLLRAMELKPGRAFSENIVAYRMAWFNDGCFWVEAVLATREEHSA